MKFLFGALILCFVSTTAYSQIKGIDQFGVELGMIVGSETYCDLSYDHDVVDALLESDERAQSPEFRQSYNMVKTAYAKSIEAGMQSGMKEMIEEHGREKAMEALEATKADLCNQAEQAAKEYGFIN